MMIVESVTLGAIEVDSKDIIRFPSGMPGFEQLHEFVLLHPDPSLPFSYIQSVEDVAVSLLAVNPFDFYPQYDIVLPDSVQEELEIRSEQDVVVLSVVSLCGSLEQATLNLLAPVIINAPRRKGKQVILHNSVYQSKHPLLQFTGEKEA